MCALGMHTHAYMPKDYYIHLFSDQVMTWANWWTEKKKSIYPKNVYIKRKKIGASLSYFSVSIIHTYANIYPHT